MTSSVVSNDNHSAVPKGALSAETSASTMGVPPTHPDEHSLASVLRQSQVENASKEKNVIENSSDKSQIMTEVGFRKKRRRKKRREKGHDAIESNHNLSAAPKGTFLTETSSAALAVPPTHPDERSLDSVARQDDVESALKEKNMIKNSSDKSQIMMGAESSLTKNKRKKKRKVKGCDAIESNHNLSVVPKDAFSTEYSTAALVVPPTRTVEHSLNSVMWQSQVENELIEKNVLESASDKPQIMTRVGVCSRNKRKQKKRREKQHDASESNNNLFAVPKDTLSIETSTAAMVMPPTHPFQHSVDPLTRQLLAENEGKENHMLQHVTDGNLAMTNLDVNSSKKKKRKRKKARHNHIETDVNPFGVLKDNSSLETSAPTLDLPPLCSSQYPLGPVMRLSQEPKEGEAQNMIGKGTDGSKVMAYVEASSRKKNKKRKRGKTRCNNVECDINHFEVPKDAFSHETCTLALDMPSRYPAMDVAMSQCQEENQGKDLNMVEKATVGSLAMRSVQVSSRKKNKGGRRRKPRNDSLQSNVNLSGVSKGDISHLTLHSEQDRSKISHFSLGRAISNYPRKKLLVLDLNGLLADFVLGVPKGYKPNGMIQNKAVFKRPFCDDFLKFCFDKFHIGVWSSRKRKNVDAAIKLLVRFSAFKLLFAWDQRHCTKTEFQTIEDKDKPLMLKELGKLWEKCRPDLPWEKGEFNETNTLLLDDSPYKAIRNPMHTAIFPYSYRYSDTNDRSLGPGGDLRVYLEGLALAENVQEYVASHPFGQPPITESSPHWNFYCLVRDKGLFAKKKKKKETKRRDQHNRRQQSRLSYKERNKERSA